MKFNKKSKLELGDTPVPDVFILNNIKTLHANDIKVYLYLLYLLKNQDEFDEETIIKGLGITKEEFMTSMDVLQAEELIKKSNQGYNIVDLKEVEVNKSYTPKFETKVNRLTDLEKSRKAAAEAISDSFFNGVMTLGWYTDIGILFKNYSFSEDVMIALFQYCKERRALNKRYVYAVAETWHNGGVKTFEQLEAFLDRYEKFNKIKNKIAKDMRIRREFSKYEESYIKKWVEEYNYDFDVIEEALKRSTSTANPSMRYIDAIITNWYNKGVKTVKDIEEMDTKKLDSASKSSTTTTTTKKTSTTAKKKDFQNYSQREYDENEDFYDDL